jgi:hypothetical protein
MIDHAAIFAQAGLPVDLVPLLEQSHEIRLSGIGRWELVPVGIGSRRPGALLGPPRRWITVTPFVAGCWRGDHGAAARQGEGPAAQLRAELALRPDPADPSPALPPPQRIDFGPVIRRRRGRPIPAAAFETWFTEADLNATRPADAIAQAAELTFAAPVRVRSLLASARSSASVCSSRPTISSRPRRRNARRRPALQGGEAAEA